MSAAATLLMVSTAALPTAANPETAAAATARPFTFFKALISWFMAAMAALNELVSISADSLTRYSPMVSGIPISVSPSFPPLPAPYGH